MKLIGHTYMSYSACYMGSVDKARPRAIPFVHRGPLSAKASGIFRQARVLLAVCFLNTEKDKAQL